MSDQTPSANNLVRFWTWRDLTHQQIAHDASDATAFAERAGELRDEMEFLLSGGLSEGAEEALGTLAEQDMSDFCTMVDLSQEIDLPGVTPLAATTREHLAKFLDHEPWHSLMVDTDLTVALAMYENLAIREDNLPWYDISPNLVRITARVLDQANAEHLQRFAGELQVLHDRHAGELPQEVAELVRYLVDSAARRLGIEPPSIGTHPR
jgi:hypothetical protein